MNVLVIFEAVKKKFVKFLEHLKSSIKNAIELFKNDSKERKRYIFLTITFLVGVNYLMICYHIDRNIFAFFPTIPIQENYHKINIFVPDTDGTMLEESRDVVEYSSNERLALFIFNEIVKGSHFENTSIVVPARLTVRKVWIEDSNNVCVFDLEPVILSDDVDIVPGSEKMFLDALTRSIKANIPQITDVKLLERGVHSRIWDM